MGMKYWAGRQQSALTMAQDAATAATRLIHFDLAGRYGVKAASFPAAAIPPAAVLAGAQDARPTLHLRPPAANDPSWPDAGAPQGRRS